MAADQGEEPVPTAAEMEAFYKAVPKIYSSVLIVDIGKADAIQLRKIKQLLEYEHGDRALMRSYPESEVLLGRHAAFTGNPDLDLSGVLPLLKVSEYHRILFLRRADGGQRSYGGGTSRKLGSKAIERAVPGTTCFKNGVEERGYVDFIGKEEDKGEFVGADVAPFDMVVRAGDTYDLFEVSSIRSDQ